MPCGVAEVSAVATGMRDSWCPEQRSERSFRGSSSVIAYSPVGYLPVPPRFLSPEVVVTLEFEGLAKPCPGHDVKG